MSISSKLATILCVFVVLVRHQASASGIVDNAKGWLGNVYNSYFNSKTSECQRSTLQECTCFEVLQVNSFRVKGSDVNIGDLTKGFRLATKFYHPGKGGNDVDFHFANTCFTFFKKDPDHLQTYQIDQIHLQKLEKRKHSEQWGDDKFRDRIDHFNDMILSGDPKDNKVFKTRTPPTGMNDPIIDRLFLFLDDSGSMTFGSELNIGYDILASIEDRIDRTPHSVHFIGSRSYEKFRVADNVEVDGIVQEWKGQSGSTQLWEYIFNTLMKSKKIIWRGRKRRSRDYYRRGDNKSQGAFHGIEGFNEMMTQLIANGVKLRISVVCIGSEDMCKVSKYRDLAMATGGVYCYVNPGEHEGLQKQQIVEFADKITASNAERAKLEIASREAYEQECIEGTTNELSWYNKLDDEAWGQENKETKEKAASRFDTIDI